MRADGSQFWAEVSVSATRDVDGRLNAYVHIVRDMTERRRIEQLEAEGKRLIEFIAMLSHELRNPLAPLRNAVRILKHPQGQLQAAKYADMIGRQVTHLTRLVDDLMDVSRITTGKIELEKAPIEINTLVQMAAESIRSTFETYGQKLEIKLAPQPVFIEGDSVRLTQVVLNLLSNAAKYTMPEGRIEISVARNHSVVRIEVSDDGIGMSESLMQHAFDAFVQGERSLDRSQGGLGIGLTLVKKIVELHRGSVVVASAGEGKGTKFSIALPLAQEGVHAVDAGAPAAAPAPGIVLVVDDNRDAAESLVELLRVSGHEVAVAYSGQEALDMAAAEPFAAVLLDIGLPDMSGYEVARRLRRLPSMARRADHRHHGLRAAERQGGVGRGRLRRPPRQADRLRRGASADRLRERRGGAVQQPAVQDPEASNAIVLPESGTCTGILAALMNASVLLPGRTLPFTVPTSFACEAITAAGLTSSFIT